MLTLHLKHLTLWKNVNPMLSTRLSSLIKEIAKQINRIENEENGEGVEIIYMYYNGYN